jgi:thiol-disulfide isomerase/thioredoxin
MLLRGTFLPVIRSGISKVLRSLLGQVSQRVSKDGLFEQSGERPPTAPMEPVRVAEPVKSEPVKPQTGKAAIGPVRPKDGCIPVDLAGLRAAISPGDRPLIVNHWATWCDPCVDELPRLVRAAAGLGNTAEFIGVSWDLFDHPGKPEKVAAKVASFAASSGVGFASVLFTGTPAELFAACGLDVELVPQTLVIATDGRVLWHKKGIITDDDVFPLIAAAKGLPPR